MITLMSGYEFYIGPYWECLPPGPYLGRGRVVWGLYGAGGVNYSPAAAVTLVADVPWPGGGVPASLHSALQTALQSLHGAILLQHYIRYFSVHRNITSSLPPFRLSGFFTQRIRPFIIYPCLHPIIV